MKKLLLIFLVAVLLIVVGVSIFSRVGKGGGEAVMTDLLPEGPILFFHAVDIGKNLDDFTATNFWQKLKSIDVAGAMQKMGAKEGEIANYKNLEAQFKSPDTQKFFKQFLGQELAVAMYPIPANAGAGGILQLAENIFFVTRLAPDAQKTVEFLTRLFNTFSKNTSTQKVEYKKHTINIIASGDGNLKIGYVRIKDVLVLGFGDKASRRCVDMLDGKEKAVAKDGNYMTAKAGFLPGAEFYSFIDFAAFMSLVKDQVMQMISLQQGDDSDAARKQIEENLGQLQGFKVIGYSAIFDKITKVKFDIHFDKNVLHEDIRPIYDCPPVDNKSMNFVPKDILTYQWSACYDLSYYWKQMQKDMQRAAEAAPNSPSPSETIKKMEENLKLSITDDILPAFGHQLGGYLQDIKVAPEFPLPSLLLFAETQDKAKAEKVISTLIAQQPSIRLQEENYNDTVIKYVNILAVPDLAPAYALVGDYLFIATNRQMIKDSMDVSKNPGNSVTANPSFKELNFDLVGKNNSVLFVQIDTLMDRAQALAIWGNKWVAGQYAKQAAFKSGSEKRLADMKSAIETDQNELKDLREKAKALGEKGSAASSAAPTETAQSTNTIGTEALDLVKQIQEKEKSIEDKKGAIKQLEEITAAMNQSQTPDPQTRQVLVDDLVKPVLKALASLRALTSRGIFGENILETFSYLKIE